MIDAAPEPTRGILRIARTRRGRRNCGVCAGPKCQLHALPLMRIPFTGEDPKKIVPCSLKPERFLQVKVEELLSLI